MNNYLLAFLWSIPGLLVATTMHEFVRALASSAMGDNLPKSQGRLTLNPLKHFEPIGFLLLFYTSGLHLTMNFCLMRMIPSCTNSSFWNYMFFLESTMR